jgi:SMI1-KNR4 cell-wall
MIEMDIALLETELGVVLPGHYRDFLRNYPQTLIDARLNLGWSKESPTDRQLNNNPHKLVELNKNVRLPGTPWVGEDGEPWPDNYFVIGDDQCGNYYSVDLNSAEPGVWFYDHEVGEFYLYADSLEEFTEFLLEEIESLNRDSGRS